MLLWLRWCIPFAFVFLLNRSIAAHAGDDVLRSEVKENCLDCGQQSNDVSSSGNYSIGGLSSEHTTTKVEESAHKTCELFIAGSSIDGAGLGVFTAAPYKRGDFIGNGADVVVPVDVNSLLRVGLNSATAIHAATLLRDYTWNGNRLGLESSSSSLDAFGPGLEALMNGHTSEKLVNAGPLMVDGDLQTVALSDIPIHTELFAYYGHHWFAARNFTDTHTLVSTLSGDSVKTTVAAYDSPRKSRCADSIVVTNHTARAARNFVTDDIVTGSPLLHLVNGTDLLHFLNGTAQPLTQYCFGDAVTDVVLLCPYAPGVMSIVESKKPNIRVQWAPDGVLQHQSKLLEESPETLLMHPYPVLAVDYVALRNIEEGETLSIDFSPPTEELDYDFMGRASYWNHPTSVGAIVLRSESEQETNPYPQSVGFECHASVVVHDGTEGTSGESWTSSTVPCRIRTRSVDPTMGYIFYSVAAFHKDQWVEISGVPRQAIRFVDMPVILPRRLDVYPAAWRRTGRLRPSNDEA